MFNSTAALSASKASPDAYNLAKEYNADAAANLTCILQALESAGFFKAHRNSYSAFDRVLSGIAWLLQQIVRREDAEQGRVQWDILYQSHDKMKPRLGLAQEVIHCVEALNFDCPVAIQPHQLLLQDFGDIEKVQKLVVWLISEGVDASHLAKTRGERAYLAVECSQTEKQHPKPVKKEVEIVCNAFAPERRWQYIASEEEVENDEDALIQRCLLEYGERVNHVAVEDDLLMKINEDETNKVNVMAHIASQAAKIATAGLLEIGKVKGSRKKLYDSHAVEFHTHYIKAVKQSRKEQQILYNQRKEREAKLLQQVVSAPTDMQQGVQGRIESNFLPSLHLLRVQLKENDFHLGQLVQEKKDVDVLMKKGKNRAAALVELRSQLKFEIAEVDAQAPKDVKIQAHLEKLRRLVVKIETLKREKNDLRLNCRLELGALKDRIEKLNLHVTDNNRSREADELILSKIEQTHAQMVEKRKNLKIAAAQQNRELHRKLKQIDDTPSRIELVQYEKRFIELYNEVALTLEETRKYFCVYNTFKAAHEYLEKEISLIKSIIENVDCVVASRTATQAFFLQIENIIQNVQGIVAKQQSVRDGHQAHVDTLDSKYQLLLEQERVYVNAIRNFQKECEKNDRLLARVEGVDHH
ncbi:Uncharacterized conserved protein [Plasmopara halstedii]|uniref:Uncharacterized conserved protein n=1 Tax=Plasmopara halstedii TaxID=4781 RepID=A0A0P1B3Z9_PLAHL|nr:Uncharacterized conserved protein [Plasmopara halstedii]CEG49497.1 Uncharacterized conserved protein [Plasmopara halstedii]|eukprot:XP_024585866.1 Uncharacterized conserved protein [Plasmopara halstedii]